MLKPGSFFAAQKTQLFDGIVGNPLDASVILTLAKLHAWTRLDAPHTPRCSVCIDQALATTMTPCAKDSSVQHAQTTVLSSFQGSVLSILIRKGEEGRNTGLHKASDF